MSDYYDDSKTTTLRDIDEELKGVIVRLLEKADFLHISGDYINAYRSIKQVFYKIMPFDFGYKTELVDMTKEIDEYIESVGDKSVNMARQIEINKKKYHLKGLIDYYFKLIPHCLKELNLYLKIVKRTDDPDEQFSDETFTTNKSLLEDKKKELIELSSETLLKHLTPKQINDLYGRYTITKVRST